jgi:hypothetical protein
MPQTTDLPGKLVDPDSGLRSWNGHLLLPGHQDRDAALQAVVTRYPNVHDVMDISPAFHEHVNSTGPHGWTLGGSTPVTIFVLHRREADEEPAHEPGPGDEPHRDWATPLQVDTYLRTILSEDTYLRFQHALCGRAVAAAAAEQRMHAAHWSVKRALSAGDELQWRAAADHVDPMKSARRWPGELVRFDKP